MPSQTTICIRGAGDLASGVALRLFRAGFKRIIMLERPAPLAVRRAVSFCEAVYHGEFTVEDAACRLLENAAQRTQAWQENRVALLVDQDASCLPDVKPDVLIDAIMAKKNIGTTLDMAPLVIALGPGFIAGKDAHCIIETNRGHNLGRVIRAGAAEPNTGVPGPISGYAVERLLRAPEDGIFIAALEIGTMVKAGDAVGHVQGQNGQNPVHAAVGGMLRGLLRSNVRVEKGLKIGDVDPRGIKACCHTVSEKSLAIGGGVLEAVCAHKFRVCN